MSRKHRSNTKLENCEKEFSSTRMTENKPQVLHSDHSSNSSQKLTMTNSISTMELLRTPTAKHTKTVAEISKQWLVYKKSQVKESSYIKYKNIVNLHIISEYGNKYIDLISSDDLDKFCRKLLSNDSNKKEGLSPKTVSDILSVFRSIMKYAFSKNYNVSCTENRIRIRQTHKELSVITKKDQQDLLLYLLANPQNRNVGIIMCLFTGLRIGEICALRWDDISLTEKTIYVHKTLQRLQCDNGMQRKTYIAITSPKSNSSIRKIPLPDELVNLLKHPAIIHSDYLLSETDEKWVEPRSMEYYFKKVLKQCSLPNMNFHSLRHTFATRCIEAGCDVKSLSEILGHSSITITMNRYVHPSMDFKRKNIQLLTKDFSFQ